MAGTWTQTCTRRGRAERKHFGRKRRVEPWLDIAQVKNKTNKMYPAVKQNMVDCEFQSYDTSTAGRQTKPLLLRQTRNYRGRTHPSVFAPLDGTSRKTWRCASHHIHYVDLTTAVGGLPCYSEYDTQHSPRTKGRRPHRELFSHDKNATRYYQ